MMDAMLQVKDLHFAYGNIKALHGIDLEVGPKEIVALVGSNGAGKSTTLRSISRLAHGTSRGEIWFNGENITKMSSAQIARKGLLQVLEGRHIFPQVSVYENLITGAYIRKNEDYSKELEYVYHLFPRLKEREKQMGGTLSGGEQQMLAIGRVLMAKPKMIMMDEPSLGLAPIIVEGVFDIIQKINADGIPVLLVEQNSHAALSIAHRGYVIETGKVVIKGTARQLLEDPSVQEAYLGI